VISAHEREDEVPAGAVADEFHGVLEGLRAADIEMDSALLLEGPLDPLRDPGSEQYLLFMKILARELREGVDLFFEGVIQALVPITEIYGGVYHLKIEIFHAVIVIKIRTLASRKYIRFFDIMDGVTPGAILIFKFQKLVPG
jgi:hypothetical protein